MQKRRSTHETRAARVRRQGWMRAGVWIFILVFAFSVAGGMIMLGAQLVAKQAVNTDVSLIFMLVIGYFIFRAVMRASCGPRYYGQIPPPPPGSGYGPGYYGPGPGYGPGYGSGGWGPNYYGGGGMWNGLLGGLGGTWLGNEMFGHPTATTAGPGTSVADPGNTVATFDEAGNAIDPSSSTSTQTPALGDGGGGSR